MIGYVNSPFYSKLYKLNNFGVRYTPLSLIITFCPTFGGEFELDIDDVGLFEVCVDEGKLFARPKNLLEKLKHYFLYSLISVYHFGVSTMVVVESDLNFYIASL
jgi:hypothetical protein